MTMAQLPEELLLSILDDKFPCRQSQIRALATLLGVSFHAHAGAGAGAGAGANPRPQPDSAPCRNCVVHGTEATGKSAVVATLLHALSDAHRQTGHHDEDEAGAEADFQHAIVNSLECVTGRHLFETTVRRVADALGLDLDTLTCRCENLAQLTFELSRMLKYPPQPARRHFVLVFDAIDRQREAPPTLLPALARLSETVSFARTTPCPPGQPGLAVSRC